MSLPTEEIPLAPARDERPRDDGLRKETVRGSVLVVEDDAAHREFLVELVSGWGYQAMPVGSAEEAEFAVRNKRMDAAIVDVFLPGRSGTTLMSRLRERFPQAVLIGVSAMSDAATARKCKGLGADLFIGKPLDPERLAKALKSKHHSWH
ncbi:MULTISPECIES: response regulator [Corallococcus]|uniref:response regulator n=1 Tax=Corallococcus TaxID=83461 RepID=UPI00117F97E5|nr:MULTISPECIES: response regulator [Corallococcus]NBD13693.1 response regulator [Corallococcus silvisoli]TSC20900.1 response regulator [Corallococcus sp. Z5C101001]